MKASRPIRLFLLLILCVSVTGPAAEPQVFQTEIDEKNINISPAERAASDLRAAETDSAGSWGEIVGNCQMNVRFDRETFSLAEPIIAHVILRNVGNHPIVYPTSFPDRHSTVSVIDDARRALPRNSTEIPWATFGERLGQANIRTFNYGIRAGWQRKYDLRLDSLFDLTKPGTYSINISRPVWPTNNTSGPLITVSSGNALIRIAAKKTPVSAKESPPLEATSTNLFAQVTAISSTGSTSINSNTGSQSKPRTCEAIVTPDFVPTQTASVPRLGGGSGLGERSSETARQKIRIVIFAALVALIALISFILVRAKARQKRSSS